MGFTINKLDLTFNGIRPEKDRAKLQPDPVTSRTGDYKIRDFIRNQWESSNNADTMGNLFTHFVLSDNHQNGIRIIEDELWKRYSFLNHCISSPMLLYRAACTFPDDIYIQDEYKLIWQCHLKHKKTGYAVTLWEWKGSAHLGIDSRLYKIKDLPKKLSDDIVHLLNYLLSDQCAHPYGNLVAGTQAN